jgi:copper(I)-binding protein
MRDSLVLATIMSVSTLVVGARQTSAPPVTAAATTNAVGPKIQFATSVYDFGRMRSGDPVKFTYVFTNTGDALLVLNNVQPQCGCTAAGEWTKQVEPGKTGVIPIQFNTAAYNGGVLKQVTVTCNVTNQPMLFLQLKGTVYKPYDVNPQIAVFNLAPDADTASMVLTITNNMEEPLLLSALEVNNPIFAAQLITNVLGKGYQVKLTIVPPLPALGSAQGHLTLKTSWSNTPTIPVTLVANIQPAVMVTPPSLMLPPGPLATGITNSIAIQNNTATNVLTLSEPKVNAAGVGVEIREHQPGRSYSALVGFPQGFEIPPGQQIEFSVKTSNPKFPEVKVPVRQMARPPGQVPPKPTPVAVPAPQFPLVPAAAPALPAGQAPAAGNSPPPPPPPPPPAH